MFPSPSLQRPRVPGCRPARLQVHRYCLLCSLVDCCLCCSAILFSLGDVEISASYDTTGLIIVVVSLFADAMHSNSQENVLKEHHATTLEVCFTLLLCFSVLLIVNARVSGDGVHKFLRRRVSSHWLRCCSCCVVFSSSLAVVLARGELMPALRVRSRVCCQTQCVFAVLL